MAAENVVVVAEVQVTDGGAGQGLSTDAVQAAAWARHREERPESAGTWLLIRMLLTGV